MKQNESMGFVETIGIAAAIVASDVMLKSANVKIETIANADAGLITVICTGDLASCNAAVDAGKAAVSAGGTYFNSSRIPRPSSDVESLIDDHIGNMLKPKALAAEKKSDKAPKKAKK